MPDRNRIRPGTIFIQIIFSYHFPDKDRIDPDRSRKMKLEIRSKAYRSGWNPNGFASGFFPVSTRFLPNILSRAEISPIEKKIVGFAMSDI